MVKVFIVLGGVGDRSCKLLNSKTPLEAAKTKNLDYFVSKSNCGQVCAVSEQHLTETHEALIALLGNNIQDAEYNRSPIEAYGNGMDFKKGYLALRANFGNVETGRIVERNLGKSLKTEEILELTQLIKNNVKLDVAFDFKPTNQQSAIIAFKGNFSDNITNIDPRYRKIGKFGISTFSDPNKLVEARALDPSSTAKLSAKIVNDFVKKSEEILINQELNKKRRKNYLLPVNIVIINDPGVSLPSLLKRSGWSAIVGDPLEIGIARLTGMKIISVDYPKIKNYYFST